MIPRTRDEWTLEVIAQLLAKGYKEPESFDFKESLPNKNLDKKQDLLKDCCAFANSSGGFLVYGVMDDVSAPIKDRLKGVSTKEFLVEFGNFPSQCIPSVKWNFRNPPLYLEDGNAIYVVEILRSWDAPHCFEQFRYGTSHEWYCFPKRTNKGNEHMSYEEVRASFLQYYEKRLKLQLLRAELKAIITNADLLTVQGQAMGQQPPLGEFSLSILETTLADTYTVLMSKPQLLEILTQIRAWCRQVNNKLQSFLPIYHIDLGGREGVNVNHNMYVSNRCNDIKRYSELALDILDKLISE